MRKKKNRPQKENYLHIEVCSCQSSRLQHICGARQKDALVVLEGGDSGPLELPAAPGLMTVVDLALYRSLEGELTPTICSARALLTAWLYVKEQAQTVLAFLFHCVPSLVDHRQTKESCSLNRLPLRFHIPDSRGSRVVFVLFTWS